MSQVLVAYIPVLHKGYLNFFEKYEDTTVLYIVGEDILAELSDFDYVKRKDAIRALSSAQMKIAIESLGIFKYVFILNHSIIKSLQVERVCLIMPYEDVTCAIVDKYFTKHVIIYGSVFLRWNRKNVTEERVPNYHRMTQVTDFDNEIFESVFEEAGKSADWWRQVGGVIVKDEHIVLTAYNKHVPFEEMPYVFGDPRAIFKQGIHIELSTALHAEAALIAEAARYGISLNGAYLYITTFPCPPCAKLIAYSGIKKCYYQEGYAMLDGDTILRDKEVEIIFVDTK